MKFEIVGSVANNSHADQVAMPPGTKSGDLLVFCLGGLTRFCNDRRLTTVMTDGTPEEGTLYFGRADDVQDPIVFEQTGSPAGYFQTSLLIVLRGVLGVLDAAATEQATYVAFADSGNVASPPTPGKPSVPSGQRLAVLSIMEGWAGTVDGPVNRESTGEYVSLASSWGTKWSFRISLWIAITRGSPIPQPLYTSSGSSPSWRSWTVPIFLPPLTELPTRLHPRDDGRGLSSAPRIYPPTKSARLVGGYQ